jgi:hypothetical protein
MSGFSGEPDPSDELQVAADVAFEALRAALEGAGITEYDAVLSIEADDRGTTAMSLQGDEPEDPAQAAFELQLRHTLLSARALGWDLNIIRPDLN